MSDARATIVDVARQAGVSKSTVSLVLGGSSLVADSTRERVTEAMSDLGYIYHRGAATLRGAKSGVLGMVINDLSNPFYVELAIGIEQACQGGAFIPFLANSAEDPIRQQEVIRSMREHGAAGLVLAPAIGTSLQDVKPLVAGLPVVQVMRRLPGLRASLVAPENREGARKATAHLLENGHRRIAFVGGTNCTVCSRGTPCRLPACARRGRNSGGRIVGHRDDDQLRGRRSGGGAAPKPPAASRPLPFVSTMSSRSASYARSRRRASRSDEISRSSASTISKKPNTRFPL